MNYFEESLNILNNLYGHDIAMPLATVKDNKANLRVVNTYYKNRVFYVTTYGLSNKMREIEVNPYVALNHNLFVAHGYGENIGNPLDEKNRGLRDELKQVFSKFYEKHVDEQDKNTCILKITLCDALVFANDYKYFIDFEKETATKEPFVIDIIF